MIAQALQNLKQGTEIDGKYRIETLIGSGGMGAVYEAIQAITGRKVALKLMHSVYADDWEVLERFNREAVLAGSIGHDNICEVTDIGTLQNGMPYMVMPLLKGKSLADLLSGRHSLEISRCVDILRQILSALEAAHRAKIVHRDLKPANIFITCVGDREDFVKLLDFGICKVLDEKAFLELTASGTVLGTPYYMAPEQAMGSKELDHRVDLYAAGVILYEALTDKRPFNGDSYNEVMFKIASEPFVAPATINPSIPVELDRVVLKAMSRHPMDRYCSAREMLDAVEAAYLGRETSSKERLATSMSSTAAEGIASFAPDIALDNKAVLYRRLKTAALALFAVLAIAATIGILARNNARVEKAPATRLVEEHPIEEKTTPEKMSVSHQTKIAEEKTKQRNRETPSTPSQELEIPPSAGEEIPLPAVQSKKVRKNTMVSPQPSIQHPEKKRSAKRVQKRADSGGDITSDDLKHSIKGRFGTRIVEEF